MEKVVSETAHGGNGPSDLSWGGIPVVIIAGDDCQLGGVGQGAIDSLPTGNNGSASKLIHHGRMLCFKEFAKSVITLATTRRVDSSRQQDMELLQRVRIGENVTDSDVNKLQQLHLDNILKRHGQSAVDDIKKTQSICFSPMTNALATTSLDCLSATHPIHQLPF